MEGSNIITRGWCFSLKFEYGYECSENSLQIKS